MLRMMSFAILLLTGCDKGPVKADPAMANSADRIASAKHRRGNGQAEGSRSGERPRYRAAVLIAVNCLPNNFDLPIACKLARKGQIAVTA
jgi:hypothetical protein